MKKLSLTLVVLSLVGALFGPAGVATAKGKKPAGPLVVATDVAGDWGVNVDPTISPAGDVLGQDLVEASITMADAATVNFIIKVNALPPSGGIPEFGRYGWDFTVDGDAFAMSGGFTDYLRGVCYPLHAGTCPPPRDPGMQPFFIRQGACTVGADSLENCTLVTTVQATFDSAAGTITIPVPLEALKAKVGSKIGPGTNASFGSTLYASPAAVVSSANLPHDTMVSTGTFTVPKVK
jgi:hypothetical protein